MGIMLQFQIIALVRFAMAAFGWASGRANLLAAELIFWLLAATWGTLSGLH